MAATLYSDSTSLSQASARFSSEPGLLLLRPRRSMWKPYITIPSGMYALVSRHGADKEYVYPDNSVEGTRDGGREKRSIVWPAGLHIVPPWVRISSLVTMQTIVLDLPVKACKTKDNVTVNIDVALAFRIMGNVDLGEDPELVRKFVYELKPRGLEQQLRDAQDEAVRGLARSLRHTEIYGIRSGNRSRCDMMEPNVDVKGLGHRDEILVGESDERDRDAAKSATEEGMDVTESMKKRLNQQFMPLGVEILSVMIQSCTLPPSITTQMEEKTKLISVDAQQQMFHHNNMQNTRMEEEIVTLMQTFEEQRQQEESAGKEMINEEKVKLDDMKADAVKSEATIIEEGVARIEKLKAESALEVQRIVSRKDQTIATMKLEAQREAANLHASTKLEVERKIAQASIIAAKNRAQASRILARAEGITAPMLHYKNVHETKLRHIQVCQSLANADNMILCDSEDDDANVIAIADSILAESGGNLSRSSVLAELSLMNKVSRDQKKMKLKTITSILFVLELADGRYIRKARNDLRTNRGVIKWAVSKTLRRCQPNFEDYEDCLIRWGDCDDLRDDYFECLYENGEVDTYSACDLSSTNVAQISIEERAGAYSSNNTTSNFGTDMFAHLSEANPQENILFSPLSVYRALELVEDGATAGSKTRAELDDLLGPSDLRAKIKALQRFDTTGGAVQLNMATSIWANDLKAKYMNHTTNDHFADAFELPQTYTPVDEWIERETHGMIKDLMGDDTIEDLTVALLVDAVYFKGSWMYEFDKDLNKDGLFYYRDGSHTNATYMQSARKMKATKLSSLGDASVVALDYKNAEFSALFILPASDSEKSMQDAISGLNSQSLTKLIEETNDIQAELKLPRFRLDFGPASLKSVLQNMGMTTAFDNEILGKFNRMTFDKYLYIKDIFHGASMEVNEEGTEAAASTVVVATTRSRPRIQTMKLVFNRPFIVVISHQSSGVPLFIGKVEQPEFI